MEPIEPWIYGLLELMKHARFFFYEFVITSNQTSDITKQTVIHYHTLRNDLYHKGKALVPTERDIKGAREAALYPHSAV